MNCQFSFGPNRSYFCSAGTVYAWSDNTLPRGLARLLEDNAHPQAMDTPYDVAFPMEPGTYALSWKTTQGEDWYEDGCLGPAYARLARFIKSVSTQGGSTSRTVFGPNTSFFSMSPAGYCWQNLPPALEDDMHACMKTRRPTSVALGVQGTYIVLFSDGTVTFDLRGQYPLVESMIRNTQEAGRRRGVMYVALNPFIAGEYYAVYGDASASWNFPTAWTPDVTAISQQIKAMPAQPAPAAVVSPGGTASQKPPAPPPMQAAPGGTGPPPAASPTSAGSTVSGVASFVGQAIEFVAHEVAPAPPPPAYVPIPQAHAAPVTHPQAAPQSPPAEAPAHKITWQEGLSMGLKAAQGINKIINVLDGPSQNQDQGSGQQDGQSGFDFSAFNFADIQASLPQGYDQVVVQETVYDNGNTTVDTVTWQAN